MQIPAGSFITPANNTDTVIRFEAKLEAEYTNEYGDYIPAPPQLHFELTGGSTQTGVAGGEYKSFFIITAGNPPKTGAQFNLILPVPENIKELQENNNPDVKFAKILTFGGVEWQILRTTPCDENGNEVYSHLSKEEAFKQAGFLKAQVSHFSVFTVYLMKPEIATASTTTVELATFSVTPRHQKITPNGMGPADTETMTFSYTLDEPSFVTLQIFNSAGDLVNTLEDRVHKAAGSDSTTWNGKYSWGSYVPAGIYIFNFDAHSSESSMKTKQTGMIGVLR